MLHIFDKGVFTHIFIDEVHERTVEVDVLLMKIRALLEKDHDVRVIIMSATADKTFISDYFREQSCEFLQVPTKTYRIHDFWVDDLCDIPTWKCPSEVIVPVIQQFQKMTEADAFLVFLADKPSIFACQVIMVQH